MSRSTYEQPLPPSRLAEAAAGYRRDGRPVAGKRHVYPEMAAAGLWTTAGDLARFAVAIQRSLRGDEGSLLSTATAERMVTRFIGDHGLGFGIEEHGGETYFAHGGADEGFQAYLVAHRAGWGAAVMANSDNGIALAVEILRGLARQEGWKGYLEEPLAPAMLAARERQALAGRYRLGSDDAVTIEARDGALRGRAEGEAFELFAVEGGRVVRKDRLWRARPIREAGLVRALEVEAEEGRREAPRMEAGETIPLDHAEAGNAEDASRAYRALRASKPDDPGVAERRLNRLGYLLAQRGNLAGAIAVLQANTELYPGSANTWDSLAEVSLQAGRRERALECYRKVLEVLPRDRGADEAAKRQLRALAEKALEDLAP
jgi:tetratricopeptide (TPR) repeat protein